MCKNLIEHNRVLLFLLQQRVAKKTARKRNVFLHTLFLKKKRKPVKKKDKIMFSYHSVAHIPKIMQIWPKIKNGPNLDIRRLCPRPFNYLLSMLTTEILILYHFKVTPNLASWSICISLYNSAITHNNTCDSVVKQIKHQIICTQIICSVRWNHHGFTTVVQFWILCLLLLSLAEFH